MSSRAAVRRTLDRHRRWLAAAAASAPPGWAAAPAPDLHQVVANIQAWLMGILFAIASLFLVVSALYRITAGGDPTQIDKSRAAFRNALVGYAIALLAPLFLQVVRSVVQG